MKYYFSIILSIWVVSLSYTQKYTLSESERYQRKELENTYYGEAGYKTIYLIKNKEDTIANYEVGLYDYYAKSIEVSEVHGIDRIKSKIKVDISDMACCTSIATYYYLVTDKNKILSLNKILNTHCDGPQPRYDLIFPDDPKGMKNSIHLGRLIYDQKVKWPDLKVKYTELIVEVFPDKL